MYIENITIEGFKSYAQRVSITNFDRYFNAITGLNGSGKSNILDSICFVLGITNLSQVRANNLQELVYKQGQAGITKATVSIVFNNRDKENGPVGYEHYDEITVTRQLVIGGRNKYLINGHVAQPTRVQNLFHSVQLNVNNPHFLIMQGRITKVLNMSPLEILGMLEEAAGTRMYEQKKESALKTLQKKEGKVDEINKVLQEDILPALEKLRHERSQYAEYEQAKVDQDRLMRFCVGYNYTECLELQKEGQDKVSSLRQEAGQAGLEVAGLQAELVEKDADIASLKTEKELQAGGEIKELSEKADKLGKILVKDTTLWTNKQEMLAAEEATGSQLEASIAELAAEGLEAQVEAASAARDQAQAAADAATAAIEAAQRELAGAEAGDGRDESNRSMQERLTDAVTAQTAAEAEAKQADIKAKHAQKQLAEQQKLLAAKERDGYNPAAELAQEEAAVAAAQQRLAGLDYNEAAANELKAVVEKEKAEVARCREHVEQLGSRLQGLEFRYRDPERNFDRSRVKGVVASLVRLEDPAATTALEVAAGSKLYQVVVDSEQTARQLLANGQLRTRVTIIPLNKVAARTASATVQAAAAKLGQGKARLALQLVGYDDEVSAAMKYVFGNTFVCQDPATAKKLAFHKEVAMRCISLEGDDFNPGGTLTGGARGNRASVLSSLQALHSAEAELARRQAALEHAQEQLGSMAAAAKQHKELSTQLELKRHALGLLRERVAGSETAQLATGIKALKAELSKAKDAAAAARQNKADLAAAAKELEALINNFSKDKDRHVKTAQANLRTAKAAAEAAKKAAKAAGQALQQATAQIEAASAERAALTEQLDAAKATVAGLQKEVLELAARVAAGKAEFEAAAGRMAEKKARLAECDEEIASVVAEKRRIEDRMQQVAAERRRLESRADKMKKEMEGSEERCSKLLRDYPWIPGEQKYFGKAGTDYDWSPTGLDVKKTFDEYNAAKDTLDRLEKKVNKKAHNMFDKAEEEFRALSDKKRIVEADKAKIEKVISELDEVKKKALEKTWLQVNANFGSIFSTLLPGTSAKLEPPEGCSFMFGLEVKVAFGSVWKQSLTELSGGQRSLLALSLILAMLLFKPAPIYILDEVDAALDLSHTQNIGTMIRTHFPQSQFIVVSLKEGMFNNANVIFRTKFVDGVSTVTRTVNDPRRPTAEQAMRRAKPAGRSPTRPALAENIRE